LTSFRPVQSFNFWRAWVVVHSLQSSGCLSKNINITITTNTIISLLAGSSNSAQQAQVIMAVQDFLHQP
jgi:hypothetical protein